MENLDLLLNQRAEAETVDESLNFLNTLGGIASEDAPLKMEKPSKPKKPKVTGPSSVPPSGAAPTKPVSADLSAPPEDVEPIPPKQEKAPPAPDAGLADVADLAGEAPAKPGVLATVGNVAKDIGQGIVEAPEQIAAGASEAISAMVGLGDMLEEVMPLGGMQLWDLEGNWAPKLGSAADVARDMNERAKTKQPFLPTVGSPAKSVTGAMVNGMAQFLTGFATGGHMLRGTAAAGKMGFVGTSMAKGMFSDFAAFDGHEERLSDLINQFPMLANPVTEYLASDPEDTEGEGRFKNMAEGLIPDALFTGFVASLKAIKQARAVKAATGSKTYLEAADALTNEIKATGRLPSSGTDPLAAIGDSTPGAPLIIKGKLKAADEFASGIEPKSVVPKVGAAPMAPKGLADKIPVGDTFINFARINSDEDIKSVIKSMAKMGADDIGKAQRGVRSNAETIAAAGKKYDEVWEGLLARKKGELSFNAEEQLALRQMWNMSGEKVLETAKLAEAQPTAENLLAFRKMLTIHKLVQDQAMAVRTETARALQQWNIPAGTGGKERINAMHNILLHHGGTDVNIDLARKFSGLADEIAADPKAMEKLSKAAEKADSYKTLKAVNEAWIGISLLSGPKTHVRNMISNMGMMAASVADRAVASRVGGMLDERPAIEIGEASAQVAGIFSNVRQAWSDAATTFKTGQMKEGMSQLDIPLEMAMRSLDQNTLLGKTMYALSYAAQPVFRGLMASDQFFKTMNYGGEIKALAYREAMRAVRDGEIPRADMEDMIADIVRNPPKQMHEAALETASVRTFTNDPGKLTKSILRVRSEYPGMRFIIPFVNTPANVFRTSIEYSPLAPVLSKYRNAIKEGGPKAALARTKLGMGTTAMLEMINLSMDGRITGSGPEPGTTEYAALKRTGWSPYTVRVGDKWVSYRGVEPFSTVMGMGADIGDYVRYSDDDTASAEAIKDMMAIGVFSIGDMMLDRSFLRGLSETFSALNDPKSNSARFADSFASSFVPRGLQEVRNVIDPTVRDARTMMDSFKTKIPYMSMTVPERRDEWGRVQSMESGWGKAYDAMSPFYAKPINIEPIDRELLQQGIGVGNATRSMQLDTARVSFKNRADIHNRYLELRGQTLPSEMASAKPTPDKVKSIKVLDGDTFELNGERVRIVGVNAPEVKGDDKAKGDMSKAELERLLTGATELTLDRRGEDKYGRTLAVVNIGNTDIGQSLMDKGFAGKGKAGDASLSLAKRLEKRYGDQTMLDVLNAIVTGNHPLSKKYEQGTEGEGGEKHRLLQKVVSDFGKAARARLVDEFPEIKDAATDELTKRAERASSGANLYEDSEDEE